jgi:hypothetical protein
MNPRLAGSFLVAALGMATCNVSNAQETMRTLGSTLAVEDGMVQVADGLYARVTTDGESYVAIGESGQEALRERLIELRAKLARAHDKSPSSEQQTLDVIANALADLSQPHTKSQTVTGDCSGPGGTSQPQLYARALSSYGLNASAYAVLTSDFSPVLATANYASAGTRNGLGVSTSSQTSTGIAYTAASASASAPVSSNACTASSYASVKCPGQSSPAISALAYSQKSPGCLL